MAASSSFAPPQRFEEYEIVRPLGQGAMGAVYLAHDTLLDRRVAIKFIKRYDDIVARERFVIEARAAARLDHANVVRIYRIGELDDRPYIVTEFVSGRSLSSLSRPQPWRDVLEIARDLANGLAAAHRSGVLHRDIKPANAVRLDDGRVVLLDFGLAKLDGVVGRPEPVTGLIGEIPADELVGDETLEPDDDSQSREAGDDPSVHGPKAVLTREGAVLGTPRYMAPEIRRGAAGSSAADVYSLGAVIYELASGSVFSPSSSRALLDEVPDIDPVFSKVIARCLATNPRERYASAEPVAVALENVERGRTLGSVQLAQGDNPYRGLLSFELEHASVFRGRDNVSREVIERLSSASLVVVAGESGVGKSSFCRAGVMARVVAGAFADGRRWSTADVICGRDPVRRILEAIEVESTDVDIDDPDAIALTLRRRLGRDRGLIVHIDQLEELVTLTDARSAERAAALIASLCAPSPGLKVLASVRGDYLSRVGGLGSLGSLISRALFLLQPMRRNDLRQCVVGPAEASGAFFNDETIIDDLVDSAGDSGVALPLLQFTLRLLWERRDRETGEIRRQHLEELGGVGGALARHADSVYLAMNEVERQTAVGILTALVTSTRTRDRLARTALPGDPAIRDAVLESLLDGRLLAARDNSDEVLFELAHESLVVSWERLASWLDAKEITRIAADRVRQAARRWKSRGKRREELLRGDQLLEARAADPDDIGEDGRALLRDSKRAINRRRLLAFASVALVALVVVGAWMLSRASSRRALEREVSAKLSLAERAVTAARTQRDKVRAQREKAFAAFAGGDKAAEELWSAALVDASSLRRAFASATPHLETALSLSPKRGDIRERLAGHLFERALVTEELGDIDATDELLARLAVYDKRGTFRQQWNAPAEIELTLEPPSAVATLSRFGPEPLRELADEVVLVGRAVTEPGSYLIRATAESRAPTALAIEVRRGERVRLTLALVEAATIPPGFVHVPPGEFLYGTAEGEAQRSFYEASPIHRSRTGGFAISIRETTVAEWIEFLEAITPFERAERTPRAAGQGARGQIELRANDGVWQLRYSPSEVEYIASGDEPLVYKDRLVRKKQRWKQFPVTGISIDDARAYASWLRATGRVPKARLCREDEWERATKGADDRRFASGDTLSPDDANFDLTYGRKVGGYGLDEVGSYPESVSPYGLLDTSGNAFEMTTPWTGEGLVARGGAYYFRSNTAVAANRAVLPPEVRDPTIGLRLCADL